MEYVILVDENDQEIGQMEKMEAHEKALLHRAFSIFLFNDKNELLLQQRAHSKYHSGGLWTNTCCSHPRAGETVLEAANRRLMEEMGIEAEMQPEFSFIYRAELDNDLTEYELDHVVLGTFNGEPVINLEEVAAWKYVSMKEIEADMKANPENYTAWFRIVFDEVHNRTRNYAEI
ncbi:MAG: isopentenyl-diphosphate delta-isomerase [Fluviicola sp. XM-24bin1]|nr:MAG: isopentenyl-diphosphate delta-isomerase [Fluviicola sp. XM-24bin1]